MCRIAEIKQEASRRTLFRRVNKLKELRKVSPRVRSTTIVDCSHFEGSKNKMRFELRRRSVFKVALNTDGWSAQNSALLRHVVLKLASCQLISPVPIKARELSDTFSRDTPLQVSEGKTCWYCKHAVEKVAPEKPTLESFLSSLNAPWKVR